MSERRAPMENLADLTFPERLAFVAYLVLEAAFPLAYGLAFVTVLLDWRFGAFVLVAVFLLRFLLLQLVVVVAARHDGLGDLSTPERSLLGAGLGFYLLVFVGAFAALFGSPAGAVLIVVGLGGHFAGHLAAGVSAYRRIMARPWPVVAPLVDEDDDWW